MDTIYALASARGKAGVAVVRVSGPDAHATVLALCGDVPEARRASLRMIFDETGAVIDQGLVLVFEKGESFTGEASAEFQVHGGVAVVNAVLRRLGQVPGVRLADPGEFTRRALENGVMDLARVEGLADLVEAETEAQRVLAMRVFSGALGVRVADWRAKLVRAAALIEATIDFADEEVPEDVTPEVLEMLDAVKRGVQAELDGISTAERLRDGFEVAIVGAPNVGKSTLLNRLAGRDAALTSEVAGTTRDIIEVRMDLKGLPVTFLDTAGLRETEDHVEALGVERARRRAQDADIRVFLLTTNDDTLDVAKQADDIVLVGKADLGGGDISGLSGDGVETLIDRIVDILEIRASKVGAAVRERHRVGLSKALEVLCVCIAGIGRAESELLAEDIHEVVRALDPIIGRVGVEDLLDEIFASFCLGK